MLHRTKIKQNLILPLQDIIAKDAKWKNAVVYVQCVVGDPVARWIKRWPTYLADRVRSPLEAKYSLP